MRVLLLGGTGEATALAARLAVEPGFETLLSLAGATRNPAPSALPSRIGGFGGAEGLTAFLCADRVEAVVDATHPFAPRISGNAIRAATATAAALLRLERPEWHPAEGDRWQPVPDMADAARALPSEPCTVLLTIGRRDLAPFRLHAPQHRYLVRCIDPPDPAILPPDSALIPARFPLEERTETALLQEHRVSVMVAKNAGGNSTIAKLAAARRLGVPVVMVSRPAIPDAAAIDTVPDADSALDWLLHRRDGRAHAAGSTLRGV